jgi:hypothetical protein
VRRLLPFLLSLATACSEPVRDTLVRPLDGGADAVSGLADAHADADPELGGPCVDDGQCDDGVPCTFDRCDTALARCRHVADDGKCDDGVFCNGRERCLRAVGCQPGPVVSCEDGTACTIDRCVEETKSCASVPRDADQDGDPDDRCVAKRDCDDIDPTASSLRAEVCENGKDDNCDGQIDEAGCTSPAHTQCGSALAISAPGTYLFSTVAAPKSYPTSCTVSLPNGAHDVVAAITIPQGPPRDLDLWVTSADKKEVSVAIQGTCGQAQTELACGAGAGAWQTRARARNLAPGTHFAIVTAQTETDVELAVDFLPASSKPMNEDCAAPEPILAFVPTKVEIVDPAKDLASACAAGTGERTYALVVPETSDVRVNAQVLRGSGSPVLGLRAPACASAPDELRCRTGTQLPLLARSVPAGTYVLTVAATTPIDARVLVQLLPPTAPPVTQSCATAPLATVNGTLAFDLTGHEDAIKDGCLAGGPTAAFRFDLLQPSDVMLVARWPWNDVGAVSLDLPGCSVPDRLACHAGPTPTRVTKRGLAAGSYRAVVTDQLAQQGSLTTLVRPASAPIVVGAASDSCASPMDIPPGGAFLTGDTSGAAADFDESCDAANQPPGGAPDQIFRLVLAQPKRVVLSTEGSTPLTIVSLRSGGACPGVEVKNGCHVGFFAARSFLDQTLPAGTHWIVVDGWAGQKGPWNLDVHVVDP